MRIDESVIRSFRNRHGIAIHRLESGYYRANGLSSCGYAQWPPYRFPVIDDVTPDSSKSFSDAILSIGAS